MSVGKVLALVPARGGSKGLPRKNVLPLCGKPLVGWSIEQARACAEVDAVVVSTDDAEIADVARGFGAEVPFLRPAGLAADASSAIAVVLHALDELHARGRDYGVVVLLEPTSPLREASDVAGALATLRGTPGVESVVGVSLAVGTHPAFLYRIVNGLLEPFLGRQPTDLRRQEIEPLYFLEGSVYASSTDALRRERSFYHARTAPWIVPRFKSLEIDEMIDLIMAEALMKARNEGRI